MGTVSLRINDKPYILGCEDGGEAHLRALAELVDARVRQVGADASGHGDTRLILMAALMIADELHVAEAKLKADKTLAAGHKKSLARLEAKAIAALDAAAARLEAMAPE